MALRITKVWYASEEFLNSGVVYLWQGRRLTTTSSLGFASSTVDHGPVATSVTAKWPHGHNSEEEGRREPTPPCRGNPRELECEAKGELRCSRELKAAGAGKQGSEVKRARESEWRHRGDAGACAGGRQTFSHSRERPLRRSHLSSDSSSGLPTLGASPMAGKEVVRRIKLVSGSFKGSPRKVISNV